ncbi:hypothetical protein IB276_33260 [Ensifer sp. ENS04]|uniref:hypothetical protein n=1 Tax=Ensifer sp. ENS04 TaxID=2769281 RepID=UPI0017816B15|nr:hypothetical protein [Ensifer sp. ENS04]MBD9544317.1 hypothetical protein [Ensifer sp. ENS04]
MIHDIIREAIRNSDENGDRDERRAMSLPAQAADLHDRVSDLEKVKFKAVFDAMLDVLLDTDAAYFLNKMQLEGRKHRLLDPVHAIRFALSVYDGLDFLKCWNEGDWRGCTEWTTWKDYP